METKEIKKLNTNHMIFDWTLGSPFQKPKHPWNRSAMGTTGQMCTQADDLMWYQC